MHACLCVLSQVCVPQYHTCPHTHRDIFFLSSTMLHIAFSLLVVLVLPQTSLLVHKKKSVLFFFKGWLVVYCNNNIIKETDYSLLSQSHPGVCPLFWDELSCQNISSCDWRMTVGRSWPECLEMMSQDTRSSFVLLLFHAIPLTISF